SAGQNYQKDSEGKPFYFQVVNLLVTPDQAELLYLATDQKIQLVLRNPADHTVVPTYGATTNELFASGNARPRKAALSVSRPVVSAETVRQPRAADAGVIPLPRAEKRAPQPEAPTAALTNKVTVEVYAGDKRTDAVFETPAGSKR
ncbi:MAG TPA: hypothetical protein VNH18_07100, partial [Bryobacteraceae bacterium]|nr:hypothetical protein [Bryobacteraceae bacterium]